MKNPLRKVASLFLIAGSLQWLAYGSPSGSDLLYSRSPSEDFAWYAVRH